MAEIIEISVFKHSKPQKPLGAREIIVREKRKENLEGIPCPFCGAKITFESAKFCLELEHLLDKVF